MPEFMRASPRFFTCDPTRVTGARGDLAIQRHRQLQMHKRPARAHEVNVRFVQLVRFISQQTRAHLDSGFAKMRKAAAGDLWIRVFDRGNDSFDAGCDQRISAWRRAAAMSVRFQRDVSRGALRALPSLLERQGFGVLYLLIIVESFADDFAAVYDHATN